MIIVHLQDGMCRGIPVHRGRSINAADHDGLSFVLLCLDCCRRTLEKVAHPGVLFVPKANCRLDVVASIKPFHEWIRRRFTYLLGPAYW